MYKPVKNALGSYFGERDTGELDGERERSGKQDTHIVFGELSHCKDAKEGCLVGGCNGPQSAKRKSLWHKEEGGAHFAACTVSYDDQFSANLRKQRSRVSGDIGV